VPIGVIGNMEMKKKIELVEGPDINSSPEDWERCVFCNTPTPYWVKKKDVPCCYICSLERNPVLVPTKNQWIYKFEKENKLKLSV